MFDNPDAKTPHKKDCQCYHCKQERDEKGGTMKTRQEVEALKQNWLADGCWDIYDTEGFEEYRDELRVFQINQQQEWRAKEYNKVYSFAQGLGIETIGNAADEPNLSLARYIMKLEERIKELENQTRRRCERYPGKV